MVGIGVIIAATAMQTSRANDVFEKSMAILEQASTVVGVFTQNSTRGRATAEFHLKKDNRLAVFSKLNSEVCDGVIRTSIDRTKNTYSVRDVRIFDLPYLPGFEAFTINNRDDKEKTIAAQKKPQNIRTTNMGRMQVVAYTMGDTNVYIDPSTYLPVAADFIENRIRYSVKFDSVKLNVPLADGMFIYKPSRGSMVEQVLDQGMLRVGQRVPSGATTAPSVAALTQYMSTKKSTMVLFFSNKSQADSDMLSKMDKISKRVPKNVGLIGVANTSDWQKMFKGRLGFQVLEDTDLGRDSLRSRFGVTRYPTLYIIDENGEVTYVQIGANDFELNPVLEKLGVAKP